MKFIRKLKKRFYTKSFKLYTLIGLFITVMTALGSTIAGVFLHTNPTMLFWVNLIVVNGSLFIIKYFIYLKFKLIDDRRV